MDKGKRTIADLRLQMAVAYSRILQAEIVTEADEHGRLCLVLELGEETPQDAALRVMDTEVTLLCDEDKVLAPPEYMGFPLCGTARLMPQAPRPPHPGTVCAGSGMSV